MFKGVTPTILLMNKVREFNYFVGIDVSKKTLDISLIKGQHFVFHIQVDNSEKGFKSFLSKLNHRKIDFEDCLFCAENTGIYNVPLQNVCNRNDLFLWVEKAIQIKRSIGMVRGKNDKIDSLRIAQYAYKNRVDAIQWQPMRTPLSLIKKLISSRRRLISTQMQLTQTLLEEEFLTKQEKQILSKGVSQTLQAIKSDLTQIEKAMIKIVKEDTELNRLYELITSVNGIGMQTALEIIVTTNEFKNIKEAKKFSCYAGVVPFEYSSGTSIHKKARVSKIANTSVKTLLHMAALSVLHTPGDLRDYYERKVLEGKNKMSVINAIRHKLVLRIFACVQNNRMYEKKYSYAIA